VPGAFKNGLQKAISSTHVTPSLAANLLAFSAEQTRGKAPSAFKFSLPDAVRFKG
ncbi:unnamed protein product, partial [Prunus brigantina]